MSFHFPGDIPDFESLHFPVLDFNLGVLSSSKVAFIPHENLRALSLRFPRLGAALWRDTLVDAATSREWMTSLGRRSGYGRAAHLFCEIYTKLHALGLADQYRCMLPFTQTDLGDALGLSTVHMNRVLQELRGQGLIILKGRMLVIENFMALSKAAEFDPAYLRLERQAAPEAAEGEGGKTLATPGDCWRSLRQSDPHSIHRNGSESL